MLYDAKVHPQFAIAKSKRVDLCYRVNNYVALLVAIRKGFFYFITNIKIMSALNKNSETIQILKKDTDPVFEQDDVKREITIRDALFRRESSSVLFQMYADEEEDLFILYNQADN